MRYLIIACIFLSGCSVIEKKFCNNKNINVSVVEGPINGRNDAYASYNCTSDSTIQVYRWSLRQATLMVHEFVHILGRVGDSGHNPDPNCAFHSTAQKITEPPCEYDLKIVMKAQGTYKVKIIGSEPALRAATIWAIEYWNKYAGRTVLQLVN